MENSFFKTTSVQSFASLAVLLGLSFGLSGCTRPEAQESKVSFSIPTTFQASNKVGTQGADEILKDVIINISGPKIAAPIILNWSSEQPSDLCTASGSCSFMAPMGSERLIQVLAIYKSAESESFLYGDKTTGIEASNLPLEISVSSIFSGSNIVEADIKGRFLTAANAGPTGIVDIKFKPEGKPSMQLMRTEMINGWFRTFAMSGIKFQYSIGDLVLFGGPKSLEDLRDPSNTQILEVAFPEYYQQDGSIGSTRRMQKASNHLFGFWGPGAVGKRTCFNPSSGSLPYFYVSATGDEALAYEPASTNPAKVRVLAPANRNNDCSGLVEGLSSLTFDPLENGGEKMRGIYVRMASGRYLDGVDIGGAPHLQWLTLPGVSTVVSGYHVFAVLSDQVRNYRMMGGDNLNCQKIFNDRANIPNLVQYLGVGSAQTNTFTAANLNQFSQFLICPFDGGRVFSTTLLEHVDDGDGSTNSNPPTKISLVHQSEIMGHARHGSCQGFSLRLLDANNQQTSWNSNFNYNVRIGGTDQIAYASFQDCQNDWSPSTLLTYDKNTWNEFVMKMPESPTAAISLTPATSASINGNSLSSLSQPISLHAAGAFILTVEGPNTILPGMCYEFVARTRTVDYSLAVAPSGGYSFSIPGQTGLSLHSTSNCDSALTSPTIPQGSSSLSFWIKITASVANPFFLAPTPPSGAAGVSPTSVRMGSGSSTPAMIRFDSNNQFPVGECQPLILSLVNQNQTTIVPSSPVSLNVSYNGGPNISIYHSANCTGTAIGAENTAALSTSFSFPGGASRKIIGMKVHASGGGNLRINRSAAPMISDGSGFSFSANPGSVGGGGTATKLRVSIDEPTAINAGACIPVQLEPLNADDSVGIFPAQKTFTLLDASYSDVDAFQTDNSAYGSFHQSEHCSDGDLTTIPLQKTIRIYYKNLATEPEVTSSNQHKLKLSATIGDGTPIQDSGLINYNHTPDPAAAFKVTGKTQIKGYGCYQYEASLIDSNGNRVKNTGATISVSLSGLSVSGFFYNSYDSNCLNAQISSLSLFTDNTTVRFNAMAVGAMSGATINANSISPTYSGSSPGLTATMPLAPTKIRLETQFHGGAFRKACQALIAASVDSNGDYSVRGFTTTVDLSSNIGTNGFFFDNEASCINAMDLGSLEASDVSSVQISSTSARRMIWFLNNQTVSPSPTINLTASSPDIANSETTTPVGPYANSQVASLKVYHNSAGTGLETNFLNFGLCEKFKIRRLNSSQSPVFNEPDLPFVISTSESGVTLHTQSDCGDGAAQTVSGKIWSGGQEANIYVKHVNPSNISSSTPLFNYGNFLLGTNVSLQNAMTFNKGTLMINPGGSTFAINTCQSGFTWNWSSSNFKRSSNQIVDASDLSFVSASSININDATLTGVISGDVEFYTSTCAGVDTPSQVVNKGVSFQVMATSPGTGVIGYTFNTPDFNKWFNISPTSFTANP